MNMHATPTHRNPLRRLWAAAELVFCKMASIHFAAPWRPERRC